MAQDVIINEEDCGTLRGLTATAIKRNDDVVQTLYDRILGRMALNDVIHPLTGEVMCKAGEEITEPIAEAIEKSPLESVEIRSVLTCESRHGVCAKCYGRNLATARMVQKGEVVGVIAAQSIGEPGTQLTLRTFHVGGVAGGTAVETNVISKYEGRLEIDELRTVKGKNAAGEPINIVISRQSEFRIVDPKTEIVLYTHNLPYGATLFMEDGFEVKKGDLICEWDPYNAVIISEYEGKASYENVIEGITYREERDEQTGLSEKVVIESKDKTKNPVIKIQNKEGRGGQAVQPACLGSHRHQGQRPHQGRRYPDQDPARRSESRAATSREVCRVLPSSSRPATRRTPPSFRRSTARWRSARSSAVTARSSSPRSRAT